LEFFERRPACEVELDHLHRTQRRLAPGPQRDQHARDHGHVDLYLDAVATVAQQMAAAENVLEKPEEQLDRPTLAVHQAHGVCRRLHQVRRNQQVVPLCRAATPRLATALEVRLAGNLDDAQWLLEAALLTLTAQPRHLIAEDAGVPVVARQRSLLHQLKDAVVANPTDEMRLDVMNLLEQFEGGI